MNKSLNKLSKVDVLEKATKIFIMSILFLYCFSLILPVFWMLYTSVKSPEAYYLSPLSFPEDFHFENFKRAWGFFGFKVRVEGGYIQFTIWDMLRNSVIWAVFPTILTILHTAMVAYIVAKFPCKFTRFLYGAGLIIMIIPLYGAFPAAMVIQKNLGLYDNMWLKIAVTSGNFYGINFLILYGAYKSLSNFYGEAARIDGASEYTIFFKIYFPMIFSTCLVFFIQGFINAWNSYSEFLMWLPSYPNLALGLYKFQNEAAALEASQPDVLAGMVIVLIPTVTLYMCTQNFLLTKLTVGGLKG